MGPEANVLLPAVTISSLLFWTVGSRICPSSTEPSQFPLEAITCHTPGNAEAWITNWVIKYWVCCVLNCMTTSRNVTDWDVTKLELESDSDVHLSEDEGISSQSDADTTDINFTEWTDNINCWSTAPVVHKFTGGPSVSRQREPPHIN
jgi:hypothetical protein